MVLSSEQVNAMISSQVASMGNMANYSGQIGPYGQGGVPYAQPAPPQGFTPNIGGGFAQISAGYNAMQGAIPGTSGARAGMEQMGMGAVGMFAGPQSPFPFSTMYQGMQQQYNLNRALETQFDFLRAGGVGRGFSGTQQLAIGAGFRGIASQTPGLEMPELTGLMTSGAQMGQYQGVKDTVGMIRRTRELLKGWQQIATELGVTLQEAQQIQGQLKQVGVFQPGRQVGAIQGMSTMAAISGVGVQQQLAMGAMGAQLAPRLFGQGLGVRQAAAGAATQQLTMISTAARQGLISEGQIFEATGQSGLEGRMALAQSMNVAGAKFMRRGRGRVTLAAFVDPDTMQMDQDALQKFMTGNMGLGEIERRAKQNASKMGYVRWRANRSRMAAEFTQETSGLGHLALMRSFLGEGAMEDTERARIILSRQTGMSQSEVDAIMPMLRELPVMQSRMRNEMRTAQKQRGISQMHAEYGPQAMADRQKQKIRDAVVGPLEGVRDQLMRGFMEAYEDTVDEAIGDYQITVSESTKAVYADMMRGGPGAARGQRRLAATAGGLDPSMRAFMEASALRGGRGDRGITGLSAKGLLQNPAGAYGEILGALGVTGRGLMGKVGAWAGARGMEEMFAEMPRIQDAEMARAIGADGVSAATLNMPAGNFNALMGDQTIANILAGGGSFSDKLTAVKAQAKKRHFNVSDDQAKAIMAGISKQKGYLEDIDLIGPGGMQPGSIKQLREVSDQYISTVIEGISKTSAAGAELKGMDEQARDWLVDDELMSMVEQGRDIAEIKARAVKKFGPEAGEFYDRALTARGKTGEAKTEMEKNLRSALLQAGRAEFGAQYRELGKRAYASDIEDVTQARNKGTLNAALSKATRPQQELVEQYQAALAMFETDPVAAAEAMRKVNEAALAGNTDEAMITLAQEAGLKEWATTLSYARGAGAGIKTQARKGARGRRKARGTVAAGVLGETAEKYADAFRGGLTTKEIEEIAVDLEKQDQAGLADELRKVGAASADELGEMHEKQQARLYKAKVMAEKEQEEAIREKEQDKEHQHRAILDTAINTEKIATALADKGGIKVTVKNVASFLTDKGEEDVG